MEKSAVKKNFLSITLLILFLLKDSILICQETLAAESEIPKLVYPKYRRWMSPDNAEVVRFNSPSLQWPSKKFQKFDVRLSRDSLFKESLFQIKEIPLSELEYLCEEIRNFLLLSNSKTGGHIGANLGVV